MWRRKSSGSSIRSWRAPGGADGGADAAGRRDRLGAAGALLTRALALLRERVPNARVRVVPGVSLSLLGELSGGDLDLAVMIKPPSRCRRN